MELFKPSQKNSLSNFLTVASQFLLILLISLGSPIVWASIRCESLLTVDVKNSMRPKESNTLPNNGDKTQSYSAKLANNFEALIRAKGITDKKLLYDSNHFHQLAIKLESSAGSNTFAAGYAKVKAEFENAALHEPSETLPRRLQSAIHLCEAIDAIDRLRFTDGSSEAYLFFKAAFLRSEWTAAFASLGKAVSVITHFETSSAMTKWLVYLAYFAKNMPDSIASRYLDSLSASFYLEAKKVYDEFYNGGRFQGFEFSLSELPRFEPNSPEAKAISHQFGDLVNSFGAENKQKLISLLLLFRNSRSIEILEKLAGFDWYKRQTNENRFKLFTLVNFLSLKAESPQSDIQSDLLRNSLKIILQGDLPFSLKELKNADGSAGGGHINLNNKDEHYQAFGASLSYLSLHVICHEINHILSGQPLEISPRYFEEEYRAWYVGFIAETGRRPNKLEAATRSAYLLTYYKGDLTEAYGHIAESFKRSPEQFRRYLVDLGLNYDRLVNSTYSEFLSLVKTASANEEAPIWGCWEGCLSNKPRN